MLPEESFHIFNHANGKENLFNEPENYFFFLRRLDHFILPICKIFSYGLMPNHFHLTLQVREEKDLWKLWQSSKTLTKLTEQNLETKINKCFSNLFSSYAQAFNRRYNRKGSLFIPSMKDRKLETENDICKAIHYCHSNPVHHGFTKSIELWPYTSYNSILSDKPTKLERELVLEMFGGLNRFVEYHQQPIELKSYFFDQ